MSDIQIARRAPSRVEFIALMAGLMAINALAIDVMLPALPYMGDALGVSDENERQLVLSLYMLGFGATQLLFGPLSDRFGRRVPLMIGLVFYIVAAFAAIFAPSFGVLLFLRFVQGAGAAGTRVITQSVIRDLYAGRAMAEIMSLVFMVFMVMPVVAPAIGQLLLLTGPWWTIFLFMACLATAITIWAFIRLPETLALDKRRPLTMSSVLGGFVIVCTNRTAISYTLAGTFMFGALFGFINAAQQIYVGIYGLGVWFPAAFAVMASFMSISSYLNSRVVQRVGMRRLSHAALLVFTGFSLIWFLFALGGDVPFLVFYGLLSIIMLGFGWAASNMNSLSMEPLGAVAGTASSVFGFIQTVGGAVLGLLIGRMFDGTLLPIATGYMVMGFLALLCVLIAENGRLFKDGS